MASEPKKDVEKEWDAFVLNAVDATFYHLSQIGWTNVVEKTYSMQSTEGLQRTWNEQWMLSTG